MINPGRPTYLESSFSADDIQNGVPIPKLPLKGKSPAAEAPSAPHTPPPPADPIQEFRAQMRGAPPPPRPIEERPVSPETTEALLNAIAKVLRVATARIKYHETEAARLRAALVPFQALAAPGDPAPAPDSKSALDLLVELTAKLPDVPSEAQQ